MAVVLVGNGAVAGALAGLMNKRFSTATTAAGYAALVNAAAAFKTQFLAANAALAVPMADADNANIFLVCFAAAQSVLNDTGAVSTTATDYAAAANQAAAAAKQCAAQLT